MFLPLLGAEFQFFGRAARKLDLYRNTFPYYYKVVQI